MIDHEQFSLEIVAIEIQEMKLTKPFFELPANAKTMKSSY